MNDTPRHGLRSLDDGRHAPARRAEPPTKLPVDDGTGRRAAPAA
ncbi:MAG: hypothetical protein QM788_07000 [Roseateles sp.]